MYTFIHVARYKNTNGQLQHYCKKLAVNPSCICFIAVEGPAVDWRILTV